LSAEESGADGFLVGCFIQPVLFTFENHNLSFLEKPGIKSTAESKRLWKELIKKQNIHAINKIIKKCKQS